MMHFSISWPKAHLLLLPYELAQNLYNYLFYLASIAHILQDVYIKK